MGSGDQHWVLNRQGGGFVALFTIDEKKCRRDGICAGACPIGLIRMAPDGGVPRPIKGAERLCINCGHCLAVCPHGALALAAMPLDECAVARRDLLPDQEQMGQLIRARRSIRLYKDEPVAREVLSDLLNLAAHAPTARNSQHLGWLVINDRCEVRRLAGLAIDWMRDQVVNASPAANGYGMARMIKAWEEGKDPVLRGAPALLVLHAPADYRLGRIDATIALATLELAAFAAGLGTCWAGLLDTAASNWPPLLADLDLGEERVLCGAMMIGYPKNRYQRLPTRLAPRVTWRG